ncbi:hypothetical protein LVDJXP189_1400010 [Flavobacterium psychrophilum]|uniref:leucine-rich repeat domain-containing protein n=1 Tax=Flavobacterium psychrophilum TaxID=96345 RepID=UPI000B7C253F|nr:leucine-rich repeat domain-containing protein [Flavobacterium psychrophilum]MCB6062374.1 leucine-rich repeat domain-containing protein [Flavobacterium psychrophilum]SNB42330.1 hypothetical protein LVDJXP189_1400010 [Flavobacterium psychrophilum]
MDKNTKYIIQNHLYWAENGISKEEIYETCKKAKNDVFCNPRMYKVQEILNYKLQCKEIFSASDYEKIIFLWAFLSDDEIDLSFLKYCNNLEEINIGCYNETNLDALRNNTKLKTIIANGNKITNLEALYNHTDLEYLNIENNPCVSIKPIAHLKNIKELYLGFIDNEIDVLNILKNNPVCSVHYLIKGAGETDFENFIFPYYKMIIIQNESKIEIIMSGIEQAHPDASMIEIPETISENEEFLEKKYKKLFQEMTKRLENITNRPTIIDEDKTHFYLNYYQSNYVLNFIQ